jgi:DNA-binding IscR family transcriptional regulator
MTETYREMFIATLKHLGGKASANDLFMSLQDRHDIWTAPYYVNVKEALKEEGMIKIGRGRGGTVMLVEEAA